MTYCIACDTVREVLPDKTRQRGRFVMLERWDLDVPGFDAAFGIEPGPLCPNHARLAAPDESTRVTYTAFYTVYFRDLTETDPKKSTVARTVGRDWESVPIDIWPVEEFRSLVDEARVSGSPAQPDLPEEEYVFVAIEFEGKLTDVPARADG